jgi:lysophospholipase L1-like esterase
MILSEIFFIGDSITAGAWDASGGWVGRIISRIMNETIKANFKEKAFYCLPYNLGVSGDTVADVLLRLDGEVVSRIEQENNKEDIQMVYSIGVNDTLFMLEEGRPKFTDVEFEANIECLIELSKSISENISFLGLLPVDDVLLNPIPWAPEMAYFNEHIKRFECIIERVCKAHNLPFLPMFERWMRIPDYKKYLIDGIHPNSHGHSLLAQQIEEFLITDDFFAVHTE